MKAAQTPIKLVVMGDGSVGKTCCLLTYTTGKFPNEYIPTIFDNYSAKLTVDQREINLGLWDTAGQEEYSKIRPLSYPNTDIFLVVFAVDDFASFDNAIKKWIPEIRENVKGVPLVLVGNKIDLRNPDSKFVTYEIGNKAAADLGMAYAECSALNRMGLKELFENAVKLALKSKQVGKRSQEENKKNKDSSCALI